MSYALEKFNLYFEEMTTHPSDNAGPAILDIFWDWFKKWAVPLAIVCAWAVVIHSVQIGHSIKRQ